jgi:hypothetical protein
VIDTHYFNPTDKTTTMTKIYWTGRVARGPVENDENAFAIMAEYVILDDYLASLPEVHVSSELKAIWGSEAGVKEYGNDFVWEHDLTALSYQKIAVPVPKQQPVKQEEEKHFTRDEMEGFTEWCSRNYNRYATGWIDKLRTWLYFSQIKKSDIITTSQLLDLYIEHLKTKK